MDRKEASDYSIIGSEIDPDSEVILDSKGQRVDQAYVDRALAEVEEGLSRRWDTSD